VSNSGATKARLLLGVDGGGTSTVAWLSASGGRVLGRGQAGPSNAKSVGSGPARASLDAAIKAAFTDAGLETTHADVACLGLAGFDRAEDRHVLEGWVEEGRWAERLVLVNDGDLVVAAGTPDGSGVGVIAGTGSIAVGRTADGRRARSGGWGHLMGDEGSAYDVVCSALRLVARRSDGREPRPARGDPLTKRMCEALGVDVPPLIVPVLYAPGFDRARIAALAPIVLDAAAADPMLVDLILRPAGAALAEQALAVARALGWQTGPLPLAMAGGFLLSAADVSRALVDGLSRAGYDVRPTHVAEPVKGALILAEQAT
jgi:N-acetylglucosamine kinase-like BadF-type ATPase